MAKKKEKKKPVFQGPVQKQPAHKPGTLTQAEKLASQNPAQRREAQRTFGTIGKVAASQLQERARGVAGRGFQGTVKPGQVPTAPLNPNVGGRVTSSEQKPEEVSEGLWNEWGMDEKKEYLLTSMEQLVNLPGAGIATSIPGPMMASAGTKLTKILAGKGTPAATKVTPPTNPIYSAYTKAEETFNQPWAYRLSPSRLMSSLHSYAQKLIKAPITKLMIEDKRIVSRFGTAVETKLALREMAKKVDAVRLKTFLQEMEKLGAQTIKSKGLNIPKVVKEATGGEARRQVFEADRTYSKFPDIALNTKNARLTVSYWTKLAQAAKNPKVVVGIMVSSTFFTLSAIGTGIFTSLVWAPNERGDALHILTTLQTSARFNVDEEAVNEISELIAEVKELNVKTPLIGFLRAQKAKVDATLISDRLNKKWVMEALEKEAAIFPAEMFSRLQTRKARAEELRGE